MLWHDDPVDFPVLKHSTGYKRAEPKWFESPEVLLAVTSAKGGRTVWIYMSIDPDLLASGQELKLHKSQVVSWFGTMLESKPEEYIIHGRVEGSLKAGLVDVDGVEHIKGFIDAKLSSGLEELEF